VGWWPVVLLAAAVWFMHRANISRLVKGEELRSSFSKKA
jgi:glycerol-3-phosphate acyltransferase PlsY